MKLLFVHERLGAFGGAEANISVTASELKQRGHQLGLLHGPSTGLGDSAWRDLFGSCNQLKAPALEIVRHALWDFQPDVVYVHKMADLEVLEALVASGVPRVRMVHDHDLYCMRTYKYFFFSRKICQRPVSAYCLFPCLAFVGRRRGRAFPLRWVSFLAKRRELRLSRQFHRLLVATHYMKGELLRNGFVEEQIEIHPPVTHRGDPALCSTFGPDNLIVYVGQIVRGKGVDVLLQALSQVNTPFHCLLLGDGNHRTYCEKLSRKLGLGDRVHFKGFVPQEDLKRYYRGASMVVMSSVWPEPFGAAGLEGMRYGLPVVAFDAGGIREWLTDGHNGFLVPWMDRSRFASRVEQLLTNKPLAREMGERGREFVTQGLDLTQYIDRLEQTFGRVLNQVQERAPA